MQKRAGHIRWSLVPWVLLAALVAGHLESPTLARAQAPNVLIIITDDQRASNTLWAMPETRRLLGRNGTRYTNAFASTPLCCPSRATLFTGRYAHNTRVHSNNQARRLDPATMFSRLLRGVGYRTALAGKFLNSWPATRPPPHFDRFARFLGSAAEYLNPRVNVNGSIERTSGYATTLVRRYSLRFLRRFESQDEQPWFLYVAPNAPHRPSLPEPKYADARIPSWPGNPSVLERDRRDKPPYVRRNHHTVDDGRTVRAGQLRTLMSVDDMIGLLFDELGRLGERRDTLAIFTSDNGLTWADHGIGLLGHEAGQKGVPYTASVKVPLLLRWPGHVAENAVRPWLTGIVDIAPTVLEAAGVAPDPAQPPLDGRSLLQAAVRDRVLLENWTKPAPPWASTRTRTFQYTEYYGDDGRTPIFREYYDLRRDPWQLRNLFRDGNPRNDPNVGRIAAQLAADRACTGTQGSRACP